MAGRRWIAAAAAMAFGLAVSGCSSTDETPSAAPTPSTASSSSASAASTTATSSDDAQSQAVALVPTYLQMIDDLYLDPSRSLDDIYQVAVAPDAVTEATAIGKFRAEDYQQTGRVQLVSTSVDSVDLTSDPAASPAPTVPTVVLTACVDVSDVGAVDSTGRSIVPADRPQYLVEQLTVVNPHYPDQSSWRVSMASNTQEQSCGG